MTFEEYRLKMEAYQLSRLDKVHDIHLLAYLSSAADATRRSGKKIRPVYPTFKSFFDYEKKQQELLGTAPKIDRKAMDLLARANKRGG